MLSKWWATSTKWCVSCCFSLQMPLWFCGSASLVPKVPGVALVGERSDLPGHEGQVATHLSLGQGRPGGTVEIPMWTVGLTILPASHLRGKIKRADKSRCGVCHFSKCTPLILATHCCILSSFDCTLLLLTIGYWSFHGLVNLSQQRTFSSWMLV